MKRELTKSEKIYGVVSPKAVMASETTGHQFFFSDEHLQFCQSIALKFRPENLQPKGSSCRLEPLTAPTANRKYTTPTSNCKVPKFETFHAEIHLPIQLPDGNCLLPGHLRNKLASQFGSDVIWCIPCTCNASKGPRSVPMTKRCLCICLTRWYPRCMLD